MSKQSTSPATSPAESTSTLKSLTPMGTVSWEVAANVLTLAVNAYTLPGASKNKKSYELAQLTEELAPRNTLEALLLTQMAACHSHCMSMFASAGNSICEDSQTKYLRLAERLMRSFSTSLETLEKARRGGKQSVKVEHVHVNAGGQAIVGNVHQGERDHEQQ